VSTSSEIRGAVQAIAVLLDNHFDRTEAAAARTRNAVRTPGARTEPVVLAGEVDVRVSSSRGVLAGYSLRETGVGAVVVDLVDGSDATGTIVATLRLSAGDVASFWAGPDGPTFSYGLVVVPRGPGRVVGAVYLSEGAP
jgi:hypothetical protein